MELLLTIIKWIGFGAILTILFGVTSGLIKYGRFKEKFIQMELKVSELNAEIKNLHQENRKLSERIVKLEGVYSFSVNNSGTYKVPNESN